MLEAVEYLFDWFADPSLMCNKTCCTWHGGLYITPVSQVIGEFDEAVKSSILGSFKFHEAVQYCTGCQ